MNADQIKFNQWIIRTNRAEIAKLERELENPRLRKPETRIAAIEGMRAQIEQAEALLAAL